MPLRRWPRHLREWAFCLIQTVTTRGPDTEGTPHRKDGSTLFPRRCGMNLERPGLRKSAEFPEGRKGLSCGRSPLRAQEKGKPPIGGLREDLHRP
jgi:hypothetical protein